MFSGANVTVMVSDMDRSIRFYADTLGFELVNNYGGHWAEIQAPGVRIGLHPGGKTASPAHNMSIGLRVDDLDAVRKTLEDRAVKFVPKSEDKGSRQAHFTDRTGRRST